jgi:hypothetical protein
VRGHIGIGIQGGFKHLTYLNLYAERLTTSAGNGSRSGFSNLHPGTNKLPQVRLRLVSRSLTDQKPVSLSEQGGYYFFHIFFPPSIKIQKRTKKQFYLLYHTQQALARKTNLKIAIPALFPIFLKKFKNPLAKAKKL